MDDGVKARCNLFGVLKNMEYLVENIPKAAALVKDTSIQIQFNIAKCANANLAFKNQKASLVAGKKRSNLKLGFFSAQHFNNMIDGKALPLPLKGLSKLSFLKTTFTELASILESYLRPTDSDLKQKDFFYHNTIMTAYAAFYSLSEIANYDAEAQKIAARLPDGIMVVQVAGKDLLHIQVSNGILVTKDGGAEDAQAFLNFKTIEIAHQVLNGQIDTYTAIGLGEASMRGLIPMLESLNPILDLVEKYLK